MNFLQKLAPLHKSGKILIAAHDGIIRLLHFIQYKQILHEQPKNVSFVEFDLDKILENYGNQNSK